MKKFTFLTMCVLISVPAFAATVHLKDGGIVEGTIVEQTPQAVRIETNGSVMTYFADEIKDVNGQPIGAVSPNKPNVSQLPKQIVSPEPMIVSIDPEKKALILKFLEVFGTKDLLEKNLSVMTERLGQEKPELAQKIRDRIKFEELLAELLPVYDRNFTTEDLKAFIAFYGSPEGKKLTTTMPVLMRETVEASTRYLQRKFPELSN